MTCQNVSFASIHLYLRFFGDQTREIQEFMQNPYRSSFAQQILPLYLTHFRNSYFLFPSFIFRIVFLSGLAGQLTCSDMKMGCNLLESAQQKTSSVKQKGFLFLKYGALCAG